MSESHPAPRRGNGARPCHIGHHLRVMLGSVRPDLPPMGRLSCRWADVPVWVQDERMSVTRARSWSNFSQRCRKPGGSFLST
jgi:hypothetical protein